MVPHLWIRRLGLAAGKVDVSGRSCQDGASGLVSPRYRRLKFLLLGNGVVDESS